MKKGIPDDPDSFSPSSGGTSLEGYSYQLDVSILTALDLVLAKKLATQAILEPASQEDLELEIEDEPGALSEAITLDSYSIVIQCKLRSTGPWKHEDLSRLLAHGKRRITAKERLKDSNIRYLLVTSGDLDGVARNLRVEGVGDWPTPDKMPKEMGRNLPADAGGRVAVLASMDQEKVDLRTERLLKERFRVPHTNLHSCREKLRAEALLRMRGAGHGVWNREAIEEVVTAFGGYAGESDVLDGFVKPTNWEELVGALEERHAIIITGASGTGKTRAAKALIANIRDKIPGIRHELIQGGPERVQGDQKPLPAIYEIEDPWGRFRLEPASLPWNDAIGEILQTAGPNRKFVITTRSDVLHTSKPKTLKPKWIVSLEEEHYGPEERAKLFENRLRSLSPQLQPIVLHYKKQAVERLATPLEMHRYFAVLADGLEKNEKGREYIERCLVDAHQSSIETALVNSVNVRTDWRWAAVLWGLFKARPRLSFGILPAVQAGLTKRDPEFEDGLEPFVNFLIAGRNLRQVEAILTYQHPRVELGLEEAMKVKSGLTARVLGYLVDILIEQDEHDPTYWGTESAAHLVKAIRDQPDFRIDLSAEAQVQLDDWLAKRLSTIETDFEDDLKLAASVGSKRCMPAEVARWLTSAPKKRGNSWFFDDWEEPTQTDGWYQAVRGHSATKSICAEFVTKVLPHRHRSFSKEFSKKIYKLAGDLTPSFIEAALHVVQYGYDPNIDTIAEGAVVDLDGFEVVVNKSVQYLQKLSAQSDDDFLLALANGEYDEPAAEYYYENAAEDGYAATEFLERYAIERRKINGWQALRDHTHSTDLLWGWLAILRKAGSSDDQEWHAVATLAAGTNKEASLWEAVRNALPESLRQLLEYRLREGSENRRLRIEAVTTAIQDAPTIVVDAVKSLSESGKNTRLLELALDVRNAENKEDKVAFDLVRKAILSALPQPLADAASVVFSSSEAGLDDEVLNYFITLEAGSNTELAHVQAGILSANGRDVEEILDRVLARANPAIDESNVM